MKTLEKVDCLGAYINSFFLLKINTNQSLIDINELEKIDKGTFYHEYVHFMQDLFTLFGLRNISYLVNKIYKIHAILKTKETFSLPIDQSEIPDDLIDNYFKFYYGTISLGKDIDSIEKINLLPYEAIKLVDLESYKFVGNIKDSFYFGAFAIMESMAYLIETTHFEKYTPPCFPYRIVDLIIDNHYSDLNLSTAKRIALCEEALNSGNPGLTFIELLNKFRDLRLNFPDPAAIHSFCERNTFLKDDSGVKLNKTLYFLSELEKTKENLKIYFPNEDIVKLNKWIDFVYGKVKYLRDRGFHFYKVYENKDYFTEIINTLGTPLIANDTTFYFKNNEIDQSECDIAMFTAIKEFLDLVLGQKVNCELKNLCSGARVSLVNNNCDVAPWLNKNKEPKCYLGTLLFCWSL